MSLGCGMLCLMSKMDLIKSQGGTGTGKGLQGRNAIGKEIGRYLDPDPMLLLEDINSETNPRFHALNQAIVDLVRIQRTLPSTCSALTRRPQIQDHNLVSFLPLDVTNEDSVNAVLSHMDNAMQYGEDEEPKMPDDLDEGEFRIDPRRPRARSLTEICRRLCRSRCIVMQISYAHDDAGTASVKTIESTT